jgi:hypothetical protein
MPCDNMKDYVSCFVIGWLMASEKPRFRWYWLLEWEPLLALTYAIVITCSVLLRHDVALMLRVQLYVWLAFGVLCIGSGLLLYRWLARSGRSPAPWCAKVFWYCFIICEILGGFFLYSLIGLAH